MRIQALIALAACAVLAHACGRDDTTAEPAAESPPEVRGDVAEAESRARSDVAVAQAEGEHRVATERCEALAGAEQIRCKDEADAALEAAKTAARGGTP